MEFVRHAIGFTHIRGIRVLQQQLSLRFTFGNGSLIESRVVDGKSGLPMT
jgi:hypothetical protein